MLRKKYKRYVTISLLCGFLILCAAVAYPLINSYISQKKMIRDTEKVVGIEMKTLKQEEAPPPPPPPPPPETMVEKVKFSAPVVVEDSTIETGLTSMDDLNKKGNVEAPTEDVEVEVKDEGPKVIETPVQAEIFTVVEEQPSYPGGEEARIGYLQQNIKYPEEAKESAGLGLKLIQERATLLGGSLSIESSVDQGSEVVLMIPFVEKQPR